MNRLTKMLYVLLISICNISAANILSDGGFENDVWNLWTDGDAVATVTHESGDAQEGNKFARVTVTHLADENWKIQLQDPAWTCKKGVEYHLSFYVKSDVPGKIQVAVAGDSASPYTYRTGTEFAVGTTWKQINYYYKSDVEGSNATSFNFYCGYATGIYDFDNVVIEENTVNFPSTISVQEKSSWESGVHRNLFAELGYTQEQIDAKINSSFQQLFFGDQKSEAVYTPVGTDMAFINQPGSGSIITEGQSYGMMIAVQMNHQNVFDKLWKFAYTYMMHHSGDRKGYFSWKVNETSPYTMTDPNPAPDGEEYFVTALLFAKQRWGNKTGIFDYQAQADSILTEMLNKTPNSTVVPMINKSHAMIIFSPDANSTQYTDPSYHLPAFYSVWAKLATNDKEYWQIMADSSRAFFHHACHPVTGLVTEYTGFDGKPYPVDFNKFAGLYHSDSWRIPVNIAMDYAWCKADSWQVEQSVRLLKFFNSQPGDYKQTYTIEGEEGVEDDQGTKYPASPAQIACNAVAALASNDTVAWKFVDRLWKLPMPSGEWRYYNGLLTMLGLLHVSGKFKIWGNPALVNIKSNHSPHFPITQSGAKGPAEILDLSGRVLAEIDLGNNTSLAKVNSAALLKLAGIKSQSGIYIIKANGINNQVVTKRISIVK